MATVNVTPSVEQLLSFVRTSDLEFDLKTETGFSSAIAAWREAHVVAKAKRPAKEAKSETNERTIGMLVESGSGEWFLFAEKQITVTRGMGAVKSQNDAVMFLTVAARAEGYENLRAVVLSDIE